MSQREDTPNSQKNSTRKKGHLRAAQNESGSEGSSANVVHLSSVQWSLVWFNWMQLSLCSSVQFHSVPFSSSSECSSVHGIQRQFIQAQQFREKPREANLNQSAWRGVLSLDHWVELASQSSERPRLWAFSPVNLQGNNYKWQIKVTFTPGQWNKIILST